jgi:phosphatidylinositol glycan class O
VFLFIVDALRLDFMLDMSQPSPLPSDGPGPSPGPGSGPGAVLNGPYNKLPTLRRLLDEDPAHAALFGFRAEPPTVTAQRLRALTGGGMPTFLDIGNNMAARSISEDNWLSQLRASVPGTGTGAGTGAGRQLICIGDDTWEALFPGAFDVSLPMASFNTRDLYGVDDGIERHLFQLMDQHRHQGQGKGQEQGQEQEQEQGQGQGQEQGQGQGQEQGQGQGQEQGQEQQPPWDLFIAHFLGVDHVGHTHSAFHPLMAERLLRMDALMGQVIER